ncbi:arylsulfatase [Verrucomicrobium sp. BvORR106]|uniref:arylsulfatase n=1 Tax=Verrucomicrobium sp. BvORR106 TaxID=1403819 RepID=UPI0009DD231B|nr:arylsulfatase [Verrucomicrobium sp. BvORR106]
MRFTLLTGLAMLAPLASGLGADTVPPSRPNIIIMMADDMGWSDLGCFGSEIATPNLDSLAKEGLRFTQFYNTARCCPTRASLLTGVYPHQAGIGHMMEDKVSDGYRGELSANTQTIPEALKPAGYHSYMAGKWHVTKKVNPEGDSDKANWPLQRGFEKFYGTIHGAGSFYDPNTLVRNDQFISPYADPEYKPETYYYTDAIADHASRFVKEHGASKTSDPFFLYVAFTAPHWPLHAKEADVAKYRGKYDAGYDVIRNARWQKMKELGLVDPRWDLAVAGGPRWDQVKDRAFQARCMEVYAAMVDSLDQGVGRLIASLKESGQWENTLIFFLQDNGGCAEDMGRKGPFKARADGPTLPTMTPETLQTKMIPEQTRDGFPVRQGYGILPGGPDTYHAYGEAWANVSNTPFREYKHWVHEGGISTPLLAHWPAGIAKTRQNQLESQPGHLVDLKATCMDLAGTGNYSLRPGEPAPQGVSLRPAFAGQDLQRKAPIFFEHEGNRAVRDGQWKLVAKGPGGEWELYDMAADRTEQHNLIEKEKDRANAMIRQWETWAEQTQVLPWPWQPAYEKVAR